MSTPHREASTAPPPTPIPWDDEDGYGDEKTQSATETSQTDTEDPFEPPEADGPSGP